MQRLYDDIWNWLSENIIGCLIHDLKQLFDFFPIVARLLGTGTSCAPGWSWRRRDFGRLSARYVLAPTFFSAMASKPSELVSEVFVVITQGRQD
jgi:hypothetical protein